MRVFVTGATGFIGAAVVKELIGAGHQVLGLSRSIEKAKDLAAAGAEVRMGDIKDFEGLTAAAAESDGVIHLAFNHDFSTFQQNCEDDRHIIAALGAGLKGSDRPLLITSGTAMAIPRPGEPAVEDGPVTSVHPRIASEDAANALLADGINVSIVRLPQVHDTERQGLISPWIEIALQKGYFGYVGDGQNRWAAAPRFAVAELYRLAFERAERGAHYHAVDEEGVSARDIAEALGKRLNLPVKSLTQDEAGAYFGWMAMLAGHDMPASSAITRQKLGWTPTGPSLLEDLAQLTGYGH